MIALCAICAGCGETNAPLRPSTSGLSTTTVVSSALPESEVTGMIRSVAATESEDVATTCVTVDRVGEQSTKWCHAIRSLDSFPNKAWPKYGTNDAFGFSELHFFIGPSKDGIIEVLLSADIAVQSRVFIADNFAAIVSPPNVSQVAFARLSDGKQTRYCPVDAFASSTKVCQLDRPDGFSVPG